MKVIIQTILLCSTSIQLHAAEVAQPASSLDFCNRKIDENRTFSQIAWQEINAPVLDLMSKEKAEQAKKDIETYAPLRSYLASKFSRSCSSSTTFKTKASEIVVEQCRSKELTNDTIKETSKLIADVITKLNEQENKDVPISKGHLVEAHNLCVRDDIKKKFEYTCSALEADWNSVKSQMTAYEQTMAFRELHQRCIKVKFDEKGKTFEERYKCEKERGSTSAVVAAQLGQTFSSMGQDWMNYRQQQWGFGLQQQNLESSINFWNNFDPTKYNAFMNSNYFSQFNTYGFADPYAFSNPFGLSTGYNFGIGQAN